MFANGWFTAFDGFHVASACWLSHMKECTITISMPLVLGAQQHKPIYTDYTPSITESQRPSVGALSGAM